MFDIYIESKYDWLSDVLYLISRETRAYWTHNTLENLNVGLLLSLTLEEEVVLLLLVISNELLYKPIILQGTLLQVFNAFVASKGHHMAPPTASPIANTRPLSSTPYHEPQSASAADGDLSSGKCLIFVCIMFYVIIYIEVLYKNMDLKLRI